MDKKIFWKFNIIDLIIIAAVVLALIALIYKMSGAPDGDKKAYEFTYICENAPQELFMGIEEGEACADGATGAKLGTVLYRQAELSENGEKAKGIICFKAEGIKITHGINIEENVYLNGSRLNLVVGDSIFDGYISDIREAQ